MPERPFHAQVVLLGLDTLMPLMTPEMLRFPKVLSLHFSLLSFMLEQHPATAVGLPPSRIAMLASSLQHGLMHSDAAVCTASLEGLAGACMCVPVCGCPCVCAFVCVHVCVCACVCA